MISKLFCGLVFPIPTFWFFNVIICVPSLGINGVPNCHISCTVHEEDNDGELVELYLEGLFKYNLPSLKFDAVLPNLDFHFAV